MGRLVRLGRLVAPDRRMDELTTSSKNKRPRRQVLETDDPVRKALVDRLYDGTWLGKGDIVKVLDLGGSTVDRYLRDGTIGFRLKPGRGGYRLGDPADVLALLFPPPHGRS